MKARRIYESPDEIALPDLKYNRHGEAIDSNRWAPAFGDKDSYPFWYENGEFVLGREYSGHPGSIRGDQDSFSGRVWADRKLISFWSYPSEFQFVDIAKELTERLDKKGYDANILSDPEWKVEILPLKRWRGHDEGFKTKLIPAKDYKGSSERSETDMRQEHEKSPMDPTKKSPPKYIKKRDIRMRYAMGESKLVPESLDDLFESVNFERGKDPSEKMGIGKHSKDLKVYRCGACGTPTDEYGHELKYGTPEFQKTVDIIEKMNDTTTERTWCDTCANDAAREQEKAEARYEAEQEWQEEQWRREHGY